MPSIAQDNIIPSEEILHSLTTFIEELHHHEQKAYDLNKHSQREANLHVMKDFFGYQVERRPSLLSGGGQGLFVTSGEVPRGSLVALYPGTVYWPYEPILFQSISNQFVFRCVDSLLIDGNDRSISKYIFRFVLVVHSLSWDPCPTAVCYTCIYFVLGTLSYRVPLQCTICDSIFATDTQSGCSKGVVLG